MVEENLELHITSKREFSRLACYWYSSAFHFRYIQSRKRKVMSMNYPGSIASSATVKKEWCQYCNTIFCSLIPLPLSQSAPTKSNPPIAHVLGVATRTGNHMAIMGTRIEKAKRRKKRKRENLCLASHMANTIYAIVLAKIIEFRYSRIPWQEMAPKINHK